MLLRCDALGVREWTEEARRTGFDWAGVGEPEALTRDELAVAAGIVELLARRSDVHPPRWAREAPAASREILLVRAAETMPRLRKLCEEEGPEPLRRRRILVPPDVLAAAGSGGRAEPASFHALDPYRAGEALSCVGTVSRLAYGSSPLPVPGDSVILCGR